MEMGSVRCCLVKQLPCFSWNIRTFGGESYHQSPHNMTLRNSKTGRHRLMQLQAFIGKHPVSSSSWRAHCTSINLEESSSTGSEDNPNAEESSQESPEELLSKPLSSDELKALLADSERANLLRKLSEANQQNRFLKRQLHMKEEALVDFKSELAVMELEIQALAKLAKEIAKSAIPEGSRKINGKYIQSHLLSRLEGALSVANRSTFLTPQKKNFEAVLEKLKEQIKDVEVAQSKEVPLFWYGVAESVQVMGTFDGWSQGESLSPEYTGSYTKFSTILPLRPGRYEIKFLVDGEWQLSPEFPTVGEGLMQNNLLIVE